MFVGFFYVKVKNLALIKIYFRKFVNTFSEKRKIKSLPECLYSVLN
jgi:hypothetical protein